MDGTSKPRLILPLVMSLLFWSGLLLCDSNTYGQEEVGKADPDAAGFFTVRDHAWDNGDSLDVVLAAYGKRFEAYEKAIEDNSLFVAISSEVNGLYQEIPPSDVIWEVNQQANRLTAQIRGLVRGEEYFVRLYEKMEDRNVLLDQRLEAISPRRQWFIGDKRDLALVGLLICGSVIFFIEIAKRGRPLKVRKIAGLEAVDEAVGRATEMGRSVLFVPGIQDMNDIQTIAGLNILSHVAKTAAEFDADVEVPTSRALVMTAARETLQGSYMSAGKPDNYNPDLAYYVTDEQFGYVAYVSGMMVREKPAACFYLGAFFAESLILAETGNSIGAIQVAGTAQPSQLPFFVAACDYTLIGEELFAASAYLSGSPEELGSLKGQDVGKVIVAIGMLSGCVYVTLMQFVGF